MKKLLLLLLLGCSQPVKYYSIEESLKPYIDNLFLTTSKNGYTIAKDNLTVMLTHELVKSKGGLGVTTLHYVNGVLGQRTIEFDYDFWINASESQRQTISLHEFGHAYFDRKHSEGYSIMNVNISRSGWPQCAGSECDHQFLISELFKNKGQ